jgi:LacI family transcriptional regulator
MREVAQHAGVGLKTVSRVFNDDPHVGPATRKRVQRSLRALNYVPNTLARTFRTGKDPAVGVVVPDLTDPFFAAAIGAIESVAVPRQIAVVIAASGTDAEREQPTVESLLNRQIMGLILTPTAPDQSYLSLWQGRTPLVFIDRTPAGVLADSFVEDDHGGAVLATSHLIGYGHRRIACVGDDATIWTTRRRLAGYREALAQAGIEAVPDWVLMGNWSVEDTTAALRELLRGPEAPTALFSSNARCSTAVIPALQALRRTDVALVSFGDFPLAGALSPALTVVDQDPHRLGLLAAERVFARMDHPERRLRRKTVLPLRLILRGSGEQPPPKPAGAPRRLAPPRAPTDKRGKT